MKATWTVSRLRAALEAMEAAGRGDSPVVVIAETSEDSLDGEYGFGLTTCEDGVVRVDYTAEHGSIGEV